MPSPSSYRLLVPIMLFPTLGALVYFVWLPGSALAQVTYGLQKVILAAIPITLLIVRTRHRRETPRRHGRSLILGSLTGAAIFGAIFALMSTPLGDAVRAGAPAIYGKADGLGLVNHFLLFGIFLCIGHSLIEELYWRWLVYGHLRKRISIPAAHGVAALAFASHHLVVLSQFFPPALAVFFTVGVAVGGAIWSLIYQHTGSLAGSWLSHAIADAALIAVAYPMVTGTI
ncbi:hypothetical protein BH23VER1_BH23VER1_27250 [soil metagenome]